MIAISDQSGNTIEKYEYSVYGEVNIVAKQNGETRPISIIGNPYYFTGRRLDTETGLYYYRARMYSASLGRFMQTDPIGYADSMNLYMYVGNNPVVLVDPWGLCEVSYNWRSAIGWDWGGYFRDVGAYYKGIVTAPGDYYGSFREAGLSGPVAGVEAAIMSVGKVAGFATLAEGLEGVDVRSVQEISGGQRAFRIGVGAVQTATFAVAAANSINAATASSGPTVVSRWGSEGIQPGDWVMKGKPTFSNYFRSGKWDPGPYNEFAWPGTGHSSTVLGESLSYPPGWEAWKGLIGQRIYNP